jgi:hypothetical protein
MGFVVALQTYVLYTLGVRTVLQSLVVAPIHNPEYEGNGCLEHPVGTPSVWVRFTLQG